MFGESIEKLHVYLKIGKVIGRPIWTRSGDQGDRWGQGEVTIGPGQGFQVGVMFSVHYSNFFLPIRSFGTCSPPQLPSLKRYGSTIRPMFAEMVLKLSVLISGTKWWSSNNLQRDLKKPSEKHVKPLCAAK
jgi:hypothetical protein